MARTAEEIQTSVIDTMQTLDPSIEVDTGPIFDATIVPLSNELSVAEAKTENLALLYSTEFIKTATDEEVQAYITNFALAEGAGGNASGYCVFATYTRLQPGEIVTIPIGTLVANKDGSLIYETTEEKKLVGDNISAYYNATNAWYEISVPVQSVNSGAQYDLPAYRLIQLLTPIDGIDVIQNRLKISGGSDAESNDQKFARIENAFFGQNTGTINGVIKLVENYSPEKVSGVAVVRSGERDLFKRFSSSLALDVYVNGSEARTVTDENYTIQILSNYIVFNNSPVISVDSVTLNGVENTAWVVQKDSGVYAGSPRAEDKLVFPELILQPGDLITVTYAYNGLLEDIKNDVFAPDQNNLFDMDILVREMLTTYLTLQGTSVASSSATPDTIKTQVEEFLYSAIETNTAGVMFQPEIIKQQMIDQIAGLSNFYWKKFTTTSSSLLDVETVELAKNSIAKIDAGTFDIK